MAAWWRVAHPGLQKVLWSNCFETKLEFLVREGHRAGIHDLTTHIFLVSLSLADSRSSLVIELVWGS